MNSKCLQFIKLQWKEQFPTWYSWFGFVSGILINFTVYYFSSKAFIPGPEFQHVKNVPDFFTYVILGELSLLIPMILFHDAPEVFRRWRNWGIWESLYFTPNSWFRSLTYLLSGQLAIKVMLLSLNFFFAYLFFGMQTSFWSFILFVCWQIFAFICLAGFYFTFISLAVMLKRGLRLNGYLSLVLSVLSGAYFPLSVFGNGLLRKVLSSSPLSLHVKASRELWLNGQFLCQEEISMFLSWSAVFWVLGMILFTFIERFSRHKIWDSRVT